MDSTLFCRAAEGGSGADACGARGGDPARGARAFPCGKALRFLVRGYRLELQVESKLQQIADLRALATQVHSFSSTEPVSHTRDVTAMQDTIAKIVEEEKILNSRIDRLVDAKREIREVIDLVEDVTLRLVLEKRYLLFQPWEEIAIDLGITSRWAKDRHKEALKVVDRILEEHPYIFEKGVWVNS